MDKDLFKQVHEALKQTDMRNLDNIKIEKKEKLILDVTVAAHVSQSEPKLVRIIDTGTAENIPSNNNILEW